MKVLKILLLTGSILLLSVSTVFAEDVNLKINVDGKRVTMDVSPQLKSAVTYVPISFIAKELGATVEWQSPRVILRKDGIKLTSTVGSSIYTRGDEQFSVKDTPILHNNRVLVPLRVISEQLGCDVDYDAVKKEINIKRRAGAPVSKPLPQEDDSAYTQSPNQKWGVKVVQDYTPSGAMNHLIYVKNNESKEIELIARLANAGLQDWMTDNRLLYSVSKSVENAADTKSLIIYDPTTRNSTALVDADGYFYIPSIHAVAFYQYLPGEDRRVESSNRKLIDIETRKIQSITEDDWKQYMEAARN